MRGVGEGDVPMKLRALRILCCWNDFDTKKGHGMILREKSTTRAVGIQH